MRVTLTKAENSHKVRIQIPPELRSVDGPSRRVIVIAAMTPRHADCTSDRVL